MANSKVKVCNHQRNDENIWNNICNDKNAWADSFKGQAFFWMTHPVSVVF